MPEEKSADKRVTMADIARQAGVSKGAVSFALNDRPGISASTRHRILEIADELGWYRNFAARALAAARAGSCGLVLARSMRTLAFEPFFMELIAGIESVLSAHDVGLLMQVVPDVEAEIAVYRRWWGQRRVDGVLVVDMRCDDPRVPELRRIGLPALIIGGPDPSGQLAAVWTDEDGSMEQVVRYLATLGHRRIARVAGLPELLHIANRTAAFLRTCAELSISAVVRSTDFTAESGANATRELLSLPEIPTVIVYDNDVSAIAGLGVAHEMGFGIPDQLSIVAWDDSPFCQVVRPPLTAVVGDIPGRGSRAAEAWLAMIESGVAHDIEFPRSHLEPRGSTRRLLPAGAENPRTALVSRTARNRRARG